VEQDCVYQDLDYDDQEAIHLWLTEGGKVVALCRVCPAGTHLGAVSIGRVITTERGKGYGRQIMLEGIRAAREHFQAKVIDIEAQEYAKGFYEQVGFRQSSAPFILDGIPHIRMTCQVAEAEPEAERGEVNTGRQVNLDLAKDLAILFMILSHTLEYSQTDVTQGLPYLITFFGAHPFAAPVFMTCMGIGITYSHHRNDPAALCRRGARLFLAAYALNLFRALGVLAAGAATGRAGFLGWAIGEAVIIDILQFAGLSTLLLGALLRLKVPYPALLAAAVAMSLGGSALHMETSGHLASDVVLGLFAGIRGEYVESYFPLLNWFIFVVAGYGMGKWLRRCPDTDRLYRVLTPVSTLIFLGYTLYAAPRGIGMYDTSSVLHFYHMRTWDAFVCINAMLMTAGLGHFLLKTVPEGIRRQVTRCASDVLRIYLIQWIFVIWVFFCLAQHVLGISFPPGATLASGVVIAAASILLARTKPFSRIRI